MIRFILHIAFFVFMLCLFLYSMYRLKVNWKGNHLRMNIFLLVMNILGLLVCVYICMSDLYGHVPITAIP